MRNPTRPVPVRLTEDEHKQFSELAARHSYPSASALHKQLVRECINGVPHVEGERLQQLREVARSLDSTGRLLNQIAAAMNSGKQPSPEHVARVVEAARADYRDAAKLVREIISISRERAVMLLGGRGGSI